MRQAKEYAQRLQCRIAYATNGHDIYQIDMRSGEEKMVCNDQKGELLIKTRNWVQFASFNQHFMVARAGNEQALPRPSTLKQGPKWL